jgi:FkbM family methyltransferase
MRLRGLAKRIIYGTLPQRERSFPYFGSRVFFPKNSLIFRLACDQGIYESDIVRFINHFVKPKSVYLDVGANIGLMAIAALAGDSGCTVVSVEPSPTVLRYLRLTHAANANKDRWMIVPKAVAARSGEAVFFDGAAEQGAMSGLRDTGRGGGKTALSIAVTTIDELWQEFGRPTISVIKMDIEGGEHDALAGAEACLAAQRPALVLEWTRLNLPSYGVAEDAILEIARRHGYGVFSIPGYAEVRSSTELSLRMLETETFALVAVPDGGTSDVVA